jgi:hypothetical protein
MGRVGTVGASRPGSNARSRAIPIREASTYRDLFYQHAPQELFGVEGETTLSLGIQNVFDHAPRPIEDSGGVDTSIDSPLGRLWTVRLGHTL